MLKGLPLYLTSLKCLNKDIPVSSESFNTPLKNASQKAEHYYNILKRPLFSCDSGLYLKNVDEDDQPGVFIRRVKGSNLSDLELIEYYRELTSRYGGRLTAYYKNAIAIKLDENTIIKSDHPNLYSRPFYLTDTIQSEYREGFPLDSISMKITDSDTDSKKMTEEFRAIFNSLLLNQF